MHRTFVLLALLSAVATGAHAQKAWQSEIGVQGGFVRVKPAGSGRPDQIDVFALPGANYVLGLLTHGSVYAIIPWSEKLAVEPSFVVAQLSSGTTQTTGRVGLRADYAFTPKVYAAAGGVLLYVHSAGASSKSVGLQGALGYRTHLTGPLNARVEANFASVKKTKQLTPTIDYGLLLGVSARLHGAAPAAPAAGRRAAPTTSRAWHTAIGIQGGYEGSHTTGGQDVSGIAFPALGGSLSGIGAATIIGGPPTLFAILPIGTKTAIEPGVDIVRVQQPSIRTTGFSGNLSARLDYAVKNGWYAAAGANLNYLKYTGSNGTLFGGNVAWGYRFGMGGSWGGRLELNYSVFAKNTSLPVGPQNVVGLLLGATLPVK